MMLRPAATLLNLEVAFNFTEISFLFDGENFRNKYSGCSKVNKFISCCSNNNNPHCIEHKAQLGVNINQNRPIKHLLLQCQRPLYWRVYVCVTFWWKITPELIFPMVFKALRYMWRLG